MKAQKVLGIHDKEAIAAMLAHIESECSKVDTDELYDSMLDDCYSFEKVGGIFACMSPSRVLRECDPVAYRCGKNDWLDGERDNLVEIGNDYYRNDDVNDARDEFIDGLRDELKELESEAADLDAIDDEHELAELNDEITRKESAIEACEDYAW